MAEEGRVRPGARTRAIVEQAGRFAGQFSDVGELSERVERLVEERFEAVRHRMLMAQLGEVPVERLKDVTESRLSIGALQRGGVATIADVLSMRRWGLEIIPGVGGVTADRATAAAQQLYAAALDRIRFRLNPDARHPDETALLTALHAHRDVAARSPKIQADAATLSEAVARLAKEAEPATRRFGLWFKSQEDKERIRNAVRALERIPQERLARALKSRADDVRRIAEAPSGLYPKVWDDFEREPIETYERLGELADLNLDVHASEGHLPQQIVEAVERQILDEGQLQVSLRGYQAFGAKFALVQRRTLLGDEMGLGKTITALAVMSHLRSLDEKHFFVVCPASVLYNWSHEISRRSHLRPVIVHGYEREQTLRRWARNGGVAMTTFGTLGALPPPDLERLPLLVVDEAHYVKNPGARRSQAVASWSEWADRVLFMTGTPLENRLEEFSSLASYLQPEFGAMADHPYALTGPQAFRESVAPLYLRRNQDDVLTELPERIDAEDWVELTSDDLAAYVEAVRSRNFMAMRRAALVRARNGRCAKAERLREIVEESFESGWKVVVFSFFRDVLDAVAGRLSDDGVTVFGPLTGSIGAPDRLALVDEFSDHEGPAVLVTQIEAGGVGLNIQAASVVVLCEPQWKPSIEEQAIARCHRMGQVRPVRVHRLLATDGVDERMVEILKEKSALFDAYVRDSSVAEASPAARDISETEAARQIIEAERQRLAIDEDPNEDVVVF